MFGTWISQIVKTYDYINRVVLTLPLLIYEGTLSLLCITMILCVRTNFFEITTFPNTCQVKMFQFIVGCRAGLHSSPQRKYFWIHNISFKNLSNTNLECFSDRRVQQIHLSGQNVSVTGGLPSSPVQLSVKTGASHEAVRCIQICHVASLCRVMLQVVCGDC